MGEREKTDTLRRTSASEFVSEGREGWYKLRKYSQNVGKQNPTLKRGRLAVLVGIK